MPKVNNKLKKYYQLQNKGLKQQLGLMLRLVLAFLTVRILGFQHFEHFVG